MTKYYQILLNIIVLLQDHLIYREGSFVLEKSNSGRCHSHNEEDEEEGDKESEEAYLIFVTDTTAGVCVKKIARCKFLQI